MQDRMPRNDKEIQQAEDAFAGAVREQLGIDKAEAEVELEAGG